MKNRGTSRKVVFYGKNGTVRVFKTVKSACAFIGRNPAFLKTRPGYDQGEVHLPQGDFVILQKNKRLNVLTEEQGETILEVAGRVAYSILDPIEPYDEIRAKICLMMTEHLKTANLTSFNTFEHAVYTYAKYAKLTYLRQRDFRSPLLNRVEDPQSEDLIMTHSPARASESIDDLVGLYLPEHLQKIALLKASGLDKKAVMKRLHITSQEYDRLLDEIADILDPGRPRKKDTPGTERNRRDLSKVVLQYDLEGHLIKEWPSLMEIHRKTGSNVANISKACVGKYHTAYGFVWRFEDEDKDKD